jgi:SNF2 family DNA or RNA helicase
LKSVKIASLNNNIFIIKFSGDDFISVLKVVKSLDGREYIKEKHYWTAPYINNNFEILVNNGFEIAYGKGNIIQNPDIIIDNLAINNPKLKGLYSYQKEAVQFIESIRPNIKQYYGIIGSECGIGKTIEALGICNLHINEGSFLIICTASMKLKWQREIKKWTNYDAYIIYGEKESSLPKAKFYIINYHILGRENVKDRKRENRNKILFDKLESKRKIDCENSKKEYKKKRYKEKNIRLEGWVTELSKCNIIGIFPDESHRFSNPKAIWTKCFVWMFYSIDPKIFVPLSGTPIRKRPRNFWTILHLICPNIFNNEYRYLWKFCGPKKGFFGWTFDESSNEEELHRLLQPIMIRQLKSEVLNLPNKVYNVLPMELTKLEEKNYINATDELKKLLKEHNENSIIVKNNISKVKRLAYLAKRNSVFIWIDEYLEDHDKLVIAVWHKAVMEDLYERYKKISVKIDGSVNGKDRQLAEDRFQTDDSIKIIFIQTDAGGEGITLTASNAIAIIEMPDTPGQVIQLVGRIDRVGAEKHKQLMIYFPFANGTIENDIADSIETSFESLGMILDGKENSKLFNTSFDKNIIKKLKSCI